MTHDDCSNFSREAGTIFDVEDEVPGGQYTLEVSSPGLDRKLEQAGRFSTLRRQSGQADHDGSGERKSALRGTARKSFQDGRLGLELTPRKKSKKHQEVEAGTEIEIAFSNVEKANLVPEFDGRGEKQIPLRVKALVVMTILFDGRRIGRRDVFSQNE